MDRWIDLDGRHIHGIIAKGRSFLEREIDEIDSLDLVFFAAVKDCIYMGSYRVTNHVPCRP